MFIKKSLLFLIFALFLFGCSQIGGLNPIEGDELVNISEMPEYLQQIILERYPDMDLDDFIEIHEEESNFRGLGYCTTKTYRQGSAGPTCTANGYVHSYATSSYTIYPGGSCRHGGSIYKVNVTEYDCKRSDCSYYKIKDKKYHWVDYT